MISVNLVVTGCTTGGWYEKGVSRLVESLKGRTNAEVRKWYFRTNQPGRHPSNYAIKADILRKAARECEYVLWLDASIWAVKNIDPIFSIIQQRGYFILDNPGWSTGQWSTDKSLKFFGVSREEALQMPHCMSGVIGLNASKYEYFIYKFAELGTMGLMNADWTNERGQVSSDTRVLGHRHDQTILSLMLQKEGMTEWEDPSRWISFPKPGEDLNPQNVYLCAQGM